MNDDQHAPRPRHIKLRIAMGAVALILLLLIVPPYISVSRYRNRITQLISASLGRPVRLSSVELRMLPRPSFVLTDLVVEEDPAYGAEPILHATTVKAGVRLLSLWRGRLRIDRISVDEASLNLVHTGAGRWNLDSLFRSAAGRSGAGSGRAIPLPYLEATNSRINIKDGVEKLPYSLVSADMSFWRESSGDWRVRLRGQPARTDVSLDLADTGIVRLEATLHNAPDLQNMPLHLDMDWREAQLGQLSRLLIGSDEGWRGDLTGEVHVDGTAAAARIRARLRATGVHRAEFAPSSPMDFDATCSLVYHYTSRGMENLLCDSPVGDGRMRLTGAAPGSGQAPKLTLELDRVPAQVGLDTLRTVRNGIDPGLQAAGSVSGRLDYAPAPGAPAAGNGATLDDSAGSGSRSHRESVRAAQQPRAKTHAPVTGPLTGSLSVAGLRLSGGRLSKPIEISRVTVDAVPGAPPSLALNFTLPAGGPAPLAFSLRAGLHGYAAEAHGPVAYRELRDLMQLAGDRAGTLIEGITGPAAALEMKAQGPWLLELPMERDAGDDTTEAPVPVLVAGTTDQVAATLVVRNAVWKPGFLAEPLEIAAGTLNLDPNGLRWDPVSFTYGGLKGTATFEVRSHCEAADGCPPQFAAHFDSLDAAELQASILGARERGTLLSSLMARLRPESQPGWPAVTGTVEVGSFVLGPLALNDVSAELKISPAEASVEQFGAGLLGGKISGSASVKPGGPPTYQIEGQFENVRAADVGQLLGMTWSGDGLRGSGRVELSGFSDKELAASAKGMVHFEWRRGEVSAGSDTGAELPAALSKFDRWTADAEIANNAVVLKGNQVQRGTSKASVDGSAVFGDPPRVTFASSRENRARR